MADSVSLDSLPPGFPVYGGYDDGAWPDAAAIKARFPGATVIRFTVNPGDNEGDCLDVENGDATPVEAPGWTLRRRHAGHTGPLTYCSASAWPAVRRQYAIQNVAEPGYIVAAYPGIGVGIMYPPPAVGHQYADTGAYDLSVVADYLPGIDPPPGPVPAPLPPAPEEDMPLYVTDSHGTGYIVATDLSSKVGLPTPQDARTLQQTGLYRIIPQGALSDTLIDSIPNA